MAAVDRSFRDSLTEDVVVLRWPAQRHEAERLVDLAVPHLLFVEPGASPPATVHCLQDWIRLPADDRDVRARLAAVLARARHHPALPELDAYGQLSFGGRRAFLSPTDERIARVLVESFGRGVPEAEIFDAVWPEGGNPSKMRVHVSRLRKRLVPLGLEITSIRNFGYRLHGANPVTGDAPGRQEAVR